MKNDETLPYSVVKGRHEKLKDTFGRDITKKEPCMTLVGKTCNTNADIRYIQTSIDSRCTPCYVLWEDL
eukprot:Awhi_evm1s1145